jgi:hypothetical protein
MTVEPGQRLSSQQAYESAYRLVARYYDHERTAPILRLLESISVTGYDPDSDVGVAPVWRVCVEETLGAAPFPTLPPPWDD